MTPKKQSPLQELLSMYEEKYTHLEAVVKTSNSESMETELRHIGYFIAEIKNHLPKEQQTFSEIWDAAKLHTDDYWMTPGMVKNNAADKTEFLNQYKPKP